MATPTLDTRTAPDSSAREAKPQLAQWGGVCAMSLCVFALIASEFMPVSLLTPLATDLRITEGAAGNAITISGVFAVLTSLAISALTGRRDRKVLLLALTGLMAISGAIIGLAPNYATFMTGRALIGVVIGGFWSMSTATVMRLVPENDVPRALALLNGGNALATTVAAPLGSFLGQYIGWRGAFFCLVPLTAVALAWQFITLPSMPNRERASGLAALKVLRCAQVPLGMLAVALFFMGQFALFTYLQPFLETVTAVDVTTLSLLLLGLGLAGLAGTYVIGVALRRWLNELLIAMPLAMAFIAGGLVLIGSSLIGVTVLLVLWGPIGTAAPVAWWSWVSRVLPDDAEGGGGLMVAVIQLSITLGAWLGGMLFDGSGYRATFLASAALLTASALTGVFVARQLRTAARRTPRHSLNGQIR